MRSAVLIIVGGLALTLLLIGAVFATGSTFGQRCAAAYDDPAQQEWCVERVSNGGLVYPMTKEG